MKRTLLAALLISLAVVAGAQTGPATASRKSAVRKDGQPNYTPGTLTSVDVDCSAALLVDCSGGPLTTTGTFPFVDPTLTTARLICTGSGTTPTLCAFNSGEGLAYSGNTVILDINGLTADTAPTSTYYVPFYSTGSSVNKKVTLDNLLKSAFAALTTKTTPVRADLVALQDSAASFAPKVSTISSLPVGSTFYKSSTQITWSNSVAEQDIIGVGGAPGTGISITGGTLGTTGQCKLEASGGYLQNSGATSTIQLRVYYGATTLYDSTSNTIAAGSGTRAWRLELILWANDATNSQRMQGLFTLGTSNIGTTGRGNINTGGAPSIATPFSTGGSAATEDSTAAKNLRVTILDSTATATQTWTTDRNTLTCSP